MKRQALLSKIKQAAKTANVSWEMDREGKRHEIWKCGKTEVSIPRHREINELTAEGICKALGTELGEEWWR